MRFHAEEGTTEIAVGGQTYHVNEHGHFEVDNHEHHGLLRQLGCRGEHDEIKVEVIVAEEPPALPEGYDEAAFRALIEEAEDQKVAIERLNGENHQLKSDLSAAHSRVSALEAELSSARTVEDELRDRVGELTGLLEAATDRLQTATEDASGAITDTAGAESTTGTGEATEEAPPAAAKAKAK